MKKRLLKTIVIIVAIVIGFGAIQTFAIFRARAQATTSVDAATWSVTRNQSQSGDSLEVMPELSTDSYTLTVQSSSEVDVIYSIIISSLPNGVEVKLDNGNYLTPTSGTVRINNAGTINYNDSVKTKNHVLTFRAVSGATLVTDQEIDIDVEFKQDL